MGNERTPLQSHTINDSENAPCHAMQFICWCEIYRDTFVLHRISLARSAHTKYNHRTSARYSYRGRLFHFSAIPVFILCCCGPVVWVRLAEGGGAQSAKRTSAMAGLVARFLPVVEAFFVANARDPKGVEKHSPEEEEEEVCVFFRCSPSSGGSWGQGVVLTACTPCSGSVCVLIWWIARFRLKYCVLAICQNSRRLDGMKCHRHLWNQFSFTRPSPFKITSNPTHVPGF